MHEVGDKTKAWFARDGKRIDIVIDDLEYVIHQLLPAHLNLTCFSFNGGVMFLQPEESIDEDSGVIWEYDRHASVEE